jgi:hypothetical protein
MRENLKSRRLKLEFYQNSQNRMNITKIYGPMSIKLGKQTEHNLILCQEIKSRKTRCGNIRLDLNKTGCEVLEWIKMVRLQPSNRLL